jgi:hypothetical protein
LFSYDNNSLYLGRDYQTDALVLAMLFFSVSVAKTKAPIYDKMGYCLQILKTRQPNIFWLQKLTKQIIPARNYQENDIYEYYGIKNDGYYISLNEINPILIKSRGVQLEILHYDTYITDDTIGGHNKVLYQGKKHKKSKKKNHGSC